MKNAFATLVLLLSTTSVFAQESTASTDPPDVMVIEKSWSKEVLHPGRNPNPLAPNEDLMRQERAQKAELKRRDNGLPNQPTETRLPTVTPRPLSVSMARLDTWVYKIKVQNTGPKTIKTIFWEYQFLDPDSNDLMGNRKITSWRLNLLPGKTQVIQYRSTRQPSILVDASKLDRKYSDQFTERVIIHGINYTDGSKWRLPRHGQ